MRIFPKFLSKAMVVGLAATVGMLAANAAAAKTKLTLYTSVPTTIMSKIEAAFEKNFPDINLEVFRSGTGKIQAKIAAEKEAGGVKADVVWLADFAYYETLKEQGLLMKYEPPAANALPASLKDPEGYYYGARMIAMVVAYNTGLVKQPPKTWNALIDPKWKGQVVVPNPAYSGAALDTVGTLVMHKGLDYYKALRANGAVVERGNSGAAAKIAAGEFAMGMTLDYIVRGQKAKGSPIDLVYPKDGAIVIPSPIAIIASTKVPDAAKTFLDYAISEKGQEALRKLGSFVPVVPGMAPPKGAPSLKELTAAGLETDWGFIRRNTKWLNDRFSAIMVE